MSLSTLLSGFTHKRLTKILLYIFIAGVLLFCLWMGGLYWLSQIIHQKRPEIQKIIDTQLGYPTTFDSIETHMHLDGICLALNNVVIKDIKTPTPFIVIKQIELHPNLLQSLFKKTLILKKIQLDGLKMHFVWDETARQFKLSGLKGEDISVGSDYKDGVAAIALEHSLSLKDAEIEWQGKSTNVIQRLTGDFSWISLATKSFQFTGSQALKINEGAFFKATPLEFTFDPSTHNSRLQSGSIC